MSKEARITTSDNPYDPFSQYDLWYMFDLQKGYHSCERLASIIDYSDQLSQDEIYEDTVIAIKELQKYGALGKNGELVEFRMVVKEFPDN